MNGMINFLKPAGMTSHDAVAFMRRLLGIKRVGHTGTLDPMAAGVLPICAGKATRVAEYLETDGKKYRCEMRLGLVTDTQDIWGKAESFGFEPRSVTEQQILDALCEFKGKITQTPPRYSAVKLNGKKLYEYAREGKDVAVPPREVFVKSLETVEINVKSGTVIFDVSCSKGTYVRTICHDVGAILGCGAAMSFLLRLESGVFSLENAMTAEELACAVEEGRIEACLIPPDQPLVALGEINVDGRRAEKFASGISVAWDSVSLAASPRPFGAFEEEARANVNKFRNYYKVYRSDIGSEGISAGRIFLGIGRVEGGQLRADKVLCV
ncbi:MAG: tRNA pseudouridine(55) synthase TruB [Clostridiales Family XIII bacterium]|jgi:tRNA pseudouridine55 synthase|nr:tRNA pseudouridine(55) synthase TruB [Clostridiales Family XIII bacterium]